MSLCFRDLVVAVAAVFVAVEIFLAGAVFLAKAVFVAGAGFCMLTVNNFEQKEWPPVVKELKSPFFYT
jgi:hypothetical protein